MEDRTYFDISSGVKRGDTLSSVVFSLSLCYALRKLDIEGDIFKIKEVIGNRII